MTFTYITPPENVGQVPFRILSSIIARLLAKTSITPNQVSLVRGVVVLFALWLFVLGGTENWFYAAIFFYVFEILDHVDGDLARLTGQTSAVGPLLEQFIDTWAARPSNVFGFCIALGMYNASEGEIFGFTLFSVTVLGRLLWLEYRDYFGWKRAATSTYQQSKEYKSILHGKSLKEQVKNLTIVLYIWNNTFLLLPALFYGPLSQILPIDPLIIGFVIVALLNNLPWLAIVFTGFREAYWKDKE